MREVMHHIEEPDHQSAGCGGAVACPEEAALPRHWMRDFYLADLCLESQENSEALGRLQARGLYCMRGYKLWVRLGKVVQHPSRRECRSREVCQQLFILGLLLCTIKPIAYHEF